MCHLPIGRVELVLSTGQNHGQSGLGGSYHIRLTDLIPEDKRETRLPLGKVLLVVFEPESLCAGLLGGGLVTKDKFNV